MKGTGNESNSDAFLKDRGKTVVTNDMLENDPSEIVVFPLLLPGNLGKCVVTIFPDFFRPFNEHKIIFIKKINSFMTEVSII